MKSNEKPKISNTFGDAFKNMSKAENPPQTTVNQVKNFQQSMSNSNLGGRAGYNDLGFNSKMKTPQKAELMGKREKDGIVKPRR